MQSLITCMRYRSRKWERMDYVPHTKYKASTMPEQTSMQKKIASPIFCNCNASRSGYLYSSFPDVKHIQSALK